MPRESLVDASGGYMELAHRIERCQWIGKLDHGEHKEAWVLAHSIMDLEQSFTAFLDEHLPRLLAADGPEAICNALLDISNELRHVIYHLEDPDFFDFSDLERGPR